MLVLTYKDSMQVGAQGGCSPRFPLRYQAKALKYVLNTVRESMCRFSAPARQKLEFLEVRDNVHDNGGGLVTTGEGIDALGVYGSRYWAA